MNSDNFVQIFVSFVGGGVAASVISVWSNLRSQRKVKRIEEIRLQLQNLYGPISFLSNWNAKLLDIASAISKAYDAEFIQTKYSSDNSTQEGVRDVATQTIELGNQYVRQTKENNERIISLLEKYYSFIDPDDVEIVSRFVVDYVRMKTEVTEKGTITPFMIYQHLGSISFIHPDFIKAMASRFRQLKDELHKLIN